MRKYQFSKHPIRQFFSFFLFSLVFCFSVRKAEAGEKSLSIVIDPGHGGEKAGMEIESDQGIVYEKDINLKIAQYLCEELQQYENVIVSMTRTGDQNVELLKRTEIAQEKKADVLISLHNNARGDCCAYENGCTVLVSKGAYREELAQKEQELACNILYELSQLGLENQGMLLRDSENGEVYPNEQTADYYAIVRNGVKANLPSIIIEHAFMDWTDDYENYLSSDQKLKELARADARGIARYYQLKEKNNQKVLERLENRKEKMILIKDGNSDHNEVFYKKFFEKEESTQEKLQYKEKKEEAKKVASEKKEQKEQAGEKKIIKMDSKTLFIGGILVLVVVIIVFSMI